MECLGELDHFKGFVAFACFVELTYVADVEKFVPTGIFGEDIKHLILIAALFELCGVGTAGDTEQDTLVIRLKFKDVEITR